MKLIQKRSLKYFLLPGFGLVSIFFGISFGFAKSTPNEHCVIRLDNQSVAKIQISVNGTVLSFPVKPSDVIFGRKDAFGTKYVQSDLAISPLSSNSKSHLFVYLEGRRFTFDLSTVASGACPTLFIRDSRDNQVSVEGFFRQKK